MTDRRYQHEQEVAFRAVREAGRLCQAVRQQMQGRAGAAAEADASRAAGGQEAAGEGAVRQKEDRTPVTVADFGSQALVCHLLQEAFPGDPILAEEDASMLRSDAQLAEQVTGFVRGYQPEATVGDVTDWIGQGNADAPRDRFWTLDPIDGTKGFVRGDQYAIALALIVEGTVEVAVLGLPNFAPVPEAPQVKGLLAAAERGQGAAGYVSYEEDPAPTGLAVSAVSDPEEARFCESFESAHSSHEAALAVGRALGITADPLRVDSQAKYGIVARGDAEIYLRLPRDGYVEKIWDHAAGMLIVEEAGGRVTDMNGRPLDFSRGRELTANRGIVATNGRFHDEVVAAIDAAGV